MTEGGSYHKTLILFLLFFVCRRWLRRHVRLWNCTEYSALYVVREENEKILMRGEERRTLLVRLIPEAKLLLVEQKSSSSSVDTEKANIE